MCRLASRALCASSRSRAGSLWAGAITASTPAAAYSLAGGTGGIDGQGCRPITQIVPYTFVIKYDSKFSAEKGISGRLVKHSL